MANAGIELRQGPAYKQVVGIIQHAMDVHHDTEGCDFNRTAEEIGEEVFAYLVDKVERAEKNCPLHQNGGTANIGFTSVVGFK